MHKLYVQVCVGLCLLVATLSAARNINGSTGYIVMPIADGMRYQEYSLGLDAYSGTAAPKDIDSSEEKRFAQHWKFTGTLGTSEGSELSLMGRSEREGFFLNTKWYGPLGNYDDPLMVGIGFENISSLGTYGDYPNMFMVVTKKFLSGNSFSIGSAGRYIDRELRASMMAGAEIFQQPGFAWVGDMVAYETNRYNLNVGIRIYSSSSSYFNFSVINAVQGNDAETRKWHPTYATIGFTANNLL